MKKLISIYQNHINVSPNLRNPVTDGLITEYDGRDDYFLTEEGKHSPFNLIGNAEKLDKSIHFYQTPTSLNIKNDYEQPFPPTYLSAIENAGSFLYGYADRGQTAVVQFCVSKKEGYTGRASIINVTAHSNFIDKYNGEANDGVSINYDSDTLYIGGLTYGYELPVQYDKWYSIIDLPPSDYEVNRIIYVDGVKKEQRLGSSYAPSARKGVFYTIGGYRHSSSQYFSLGECKIGHFAVYNRILTEEEVNSIYQFHQAVDRED